jgi:hypothetical protein
VVGLMAVVIVGCSSPVTDLGTRDAGVGAGGGQVQKRSRDAGPLPSMGSGGHHGLPLDATSPPPSMVVNGGCDHPLDGDAGCGMGCLIKTWPKDPQGFCSTLPRGLIWWQDCGSYKWVTVNQDAAWVRWVYDGTTGALLQVWDGGIGDSQCRYGVPGSSADDVLHCSPQGTVMGCGPGGGPGG